MFPLDLLISSICVKWVWNCCVHNKCMSLYGKTIPLIEFLWFCGPHLRWKLFSEKALLQKAKHVRRKVEVAGKTLRIRRSRKQRDRCWPLIGYKTIFGAQLQTSIRISHGTGSFRVASQGLSRQFLKTFAAVVSPDATGSSATDTWFEVGYNNIRLLTGHVEVN